MDLSKLSATELHGLNRQVSQELKLREVGEVAQARKEILAIAERAGISLDDLMKTSTGRKKAGAAARGVHYQHPTESSLKWGGRGRKPKWINEWLASGNALEDLKS